MLCTGAFIEHIKLEWALKRLLDSIQVAIRVNIIRKSDEERRVWVIGLLVLLGFGLELLYDSFEDGVLCLPNRARGCGPSKEMRLANSVFEVLLEGARRDILVVGTIDNFDSKVVKLERRTAELDWAFDSLREK